MNGQCNAFYDWHNMSEKKSILVISSTIGSGQVGLQAIAPGLRALSFEMIGLPTIWLSAHPAAFPEMGAPKGEPMPPEQMLESIDWLLAAGALDNCAAILSGYMPSLEHVKACAAIVDKVKATVADVIYCCDPICGDHDRLYLPKSVANGLRATLLPRADIATPNLFELQHLSGQTDTADMEALVSAARSLRCPHIVVTSAPAPQGRIATLAIGDEIHRCETASAPHVPHGMGDLFAALYLGLHLKGEGKALGIATGTMAAIAAGQMSATSLPHGPLTLTPPSLQDKIFLPEPA